MIRASKITGAVHSAGQAEFDAILARPEPGQVNGRVVRRPAVRPGKPKEG